MRKEIDRGESRVSRGSLKERKRGSERTRRNRMKRPRRTPDSTKQLQTEIIQHLIAHIPRQNLTWLEAPPLFDSSTSDIFAYNRASFQLSRQFGTGFARTLVGENHIWKDGYHLRHQARHLLVKSVAAVAAKVDVHRHYNLARPPFGNFGPWEASKGQGMAPPLLRDVAMGRPMLFRRAPNRLTQPIQRSN